MSQLQSYWPSEENVTACILTEAESLADSQLLAVHEPMRLDRVEFHTGKITQWVKELCWTFCLSTIARCL